MFSKLFHKDVFFPNGTVDACKSYQKALDTYRLSEHFKKHIREQEDRSHTYLPSVIEKCLKTLKNEQYEPFEVELSKDFHYFGKPGWFITKYCVRIPYDQQSDLVVVIRPNRGENLITTAWINAHDDNHETLDESEYTTENEWLSINHR